MMKLTTTEPALRFRIYRNDNVLGERGRQIRVERPNDNAADDPWSWHLIWSFHTLEEAAQRLALETLKSGSYSLWTLVDGEDL